MIDIVSLLKPKKTKKTAGQMAKERLKLVLIHDRTDCSGDLLEMIRKDIMDVLSKYMEIDLDALDIQIGTTKSEEDENADVPALYANIPIKNLKKSTVGIVDKKASESKEETKESTKESKEETKKEEKEEIKK